MSSFIKMFPIREDYADTETEINNFIQKCGGNIKVVLTSKIGEHNIIVVFEEVVAEIIHAEWVKYPSGSGIYCSNCRHKRRYKDIHDNFCPKCGANMTTKAVFK